MPARWKIARLESAVTGPSFTNPPNDTTATIRLHPIHKIDRLIFTYYFITRNNFIMKTVFCQSHLGLKHSFFAPRNHRPPERQKMAFFWQLMYGKEHYKVLKVWMRRDAGLQMRRANGMKNNRCYDTNAKIN